MMVYYPIKYGYLKAKKVEILWIQSKKNIKFLKPSSPYGVQNHSYIDLFSSDPRVVDLLS